MLLYTYSIKEWRRIIDNRYFNKTGRAHPDAQNQLQKLISAVIDVNGMEDIVKAFEYDLTTPFKTVLN